MNSSRTHLVVVQATSFCNIDCKYCYLPDRITHKPVTFDTLRHIRDWLSETRQLASTVTLCWHAGEPLVLPAEFYDRAFEIFAALENAQTRIHHSIQTNATLVTDAHCELFRRGTVNVGVSLDGPQQLHDACRQTRDGRGTWVRTVAGIKKLLAYGIDVSAIAVIGPATLAHPDAFYGAFAELGIGFVGLNVQEIEGVNERSYISEPQYLAVYKQFLKRLFWLACTDGRVGFRELLHIVRAIRSAQFQQHSSESEPFHIVSFDSDGNFSTFSPELLGQHTTQYGPLHFGNVRNRHSIDVVGRARFINVLNDIQRGVDACRESCPYFCVCGGGAPSNKLAEHGSFASTETAFCRFARMADYDVVLELFEENPQLIPLLPSTTWWPAYSRSD